MQGVSVCGNVRSEGAVAELTVEVEHGGVHVWRKLHLCFTHKSYIVDHNK